VGSVIDVGEQNQKKKRRKNNAIARHARLPAALRGRAPPLTAARVSAATTPAATPRPRAPHNGPHRRRSAARVGGVPLPCRLARVHGGRRLGARSPPPHPSKTSRPPTTNGGNVTAMTSSSPRTLSTVPIPPSRSCTHGTSPSGFFFAFWRLSAPCGGRHVAVVRAGRLHRPPLGRPRLQ